MPRHLLQVRPGQRRRKRIPKHQQSPNTSGETPFAPDNHEVLASYQGKRISPSGVRQSVRFVMLMRLVGQGLLWIIVFVVIWVLMDILVLIGVPIAMGIFSILGALSPVFLLFLFLFLLVLLGSLLFAIKRIER